MPAVFDEKHELTHAVTVNAGGAAIALCDDRLVFTEYPISLLADSYVNCAACVIALERDATLPVIVVCDNCGQWWQENGKKLNATSQSIVGSQMHGGYMVLSEGTLRRCERCPL